MSAYIPASRFCVVRVTLRPTLPVQPPVLCVAWPDLSGQMPTVRAYIYTSNHHKRKSALWAVSEKRLFLIDFSDFTIAFMTMRIARYFSHERRDCHVIFSYFRYTRYILYFVMDMSSRTF